MAKKAHDNGIILRMAKNPGCAFPTKVELQGSWRA
jgi:hypothetical protein